MSGKKSKNQKKQWIIGFCVLLIIAATGGMIVAKMTAKPSDIEKTTKDTAGKEEIRIRDKAKSNQRLQYRNVNRRKTRN